MAKIDSHLHVWALDDERYPMPPGRVPNVPGDVDRLLASMDEAEVDGALIVQPIFHGFDHGYVNEAIAAHPDRFKGMALINPQRMDAVDQLDHLVSEQGYRGVRFNPAMWVYGVIEHLSLSPAERTEHFKTCAECQMQHIDDDAGRAIYEKAGELGVPVGFMVSPKFFDQVDTLLRDLPKTPAIIDHFGGCKVADGAPGSNADFDALLALAKHPQLRIKVSGFVGPSDEALPHKDTWPMVKALIDAYGANRLMWGTDFPWIQSHGGYVEGTKIIDQIPDISEGDRDQLMGGTATSLFGSWS
ncbi:MAG: amidohydrolase [Chloroflexi bacterium]|nr:amidohydrolase [Chloroflexota bacterium]MBT4516069.1 amidohydrolase [Chloroflexota bacterium]MBT6682565.1 amidohydrolase [Chloroflexota bacterium]